MREKCVEFLLKEYQSRDRRGTAFICIKLLRSLMVAALIPPPHKKSQGTSLHVDFLNS